ncbi:MAG: redoxin domain-containing protein, partial [Planctomycetaceae bacterium]|nr:redoxin domain-containing protein [Planctomycetaceae bacterium]
MKTKFWFSTFFLLSLSAILVTAAAAQESGDTQSSDTEEAVEDLAPGHSAHGEAFNEGPRQGATLLGGTGPIHFEVSSDNPDVQKFVEQGVGQLHGFWYFEAERSFRQAAMIDPECAICYWGMAMANYSNKKRAKGFLEKALELREGASEREAMYIDALNDWLNGKGKSKEKAQRQVDAFEKIIEKYPDDLEAKAWLGYTLYKQRGTLGKKHEEVDTALKVVLAIEPLHPVHHYRIHLWDYKDPKTALDSAAKCGASSPSIAHMWHMPGHIYSRLKRYQDAAWQQEASARTDHANMMRDRVMPDEIHNFAHNNEWLIRNLIHVGRWREALDLAKNMIELPRHPKYNTLSKRRSSYYGRLRLFGVLKQYELWPELIALTDSAYLEPTDDVAQQILRLEHRGIAFAHLHHIDQVNHILDDLNQRLDDQQAKAKEANRKHEAAVAKAREEGKKAPKKPRDKTASLITQIERAIAGLEGYVLKEYGDYSEAVVRLKKAGEDQSIIAQTQLLAGKVSAALKLIDDEVGRSENEVLPLATQIEMLWMAGEHEQAKTAFEKLRAVSRSVQFGAPPFQRLEPIAAELSYPSDWRVAFQHPEDFGERPPLDQLGPFRWSPRPAPQWTLNDHTGKAYSLSQYKGQPVLVIFYLGYGCLHCAEQLQAFAPKVEEFNKAGISVGAISTDDPEGLKVSVETYEGGMPFPLLSNDSLDVFKAYRAHDDFEDAPLHGTFLIDPNGQVLWQDIGYEPFMDVNFVLEESQRLLQQEQPLSPQLEIVELPEQRPPLKTAKLDDLPRIDPAGVGGSLVVSGEELPDAALDTFFRLSQGEQSRVVLLALDREERTGQTLQRVLTHWNTQKGADLRIVRINSERRLDEIDWIRLLTNATGLWVAGDREESFQQLVKHDVARIAIHKFVAAGHVIGSTSHGAALMADKTFAEEGSDQLTDVALALLPESVMDMNAANQESSSRLEKVLQIQPHRIGYEIFPDTPMIVRRRRISKVGDGIVRIHRFAGKNKPLHEITLASENDAAD